MATADPPITRLLRAVTGVEVVVLVVAGGGLFFLPGMLGPRWPWPLAPFDTRFLGAVYLASCVAAVLLVAVGRWSPARVVVPMIFAFTVIVLVLSVVYRHRFTGSGLVVGIWFLLYAGLPANALGHMIADRRRPPPPAAPLSAVLSAWLRLQMVALGGYGTLLLVVPAAAASFWPWPLDDFHARMYSTAFLTPALGAWLLLRAAPAADLRALGLAQVAGGVLPVAGLLIVDAAVARVDWAAPGTWAWVALFGAVAVTGAALLRVAVTGAALLRVATIGRMASD